MQVIIIGPNLRDQSKGDFHVHKVGCSDIRKYPHGLTSHELPVEVESLKDIAIHIYDPDCFDYDPDDVTELSTYEAGIWIAPCCKEIK